MSEKKIFTYDIGGKKYTQKPLVLGQIDQLIEFMQGIRLPVEISASSIIFVLGGKLSKAIAIILCEDGKHLKDKDVSILASEIEFELAPETAIKVVEDFFDCNPIASLLERIKGASEKISMTITKEAGSKKSPASSAPETSQKETASSGATP